LLASKEYNEALEWYLQNYSKCNVSSNFDYSGYLLEGQANPASKKKDLSKKLATDFN